VRYDGDLMRRRILSLQTKTYSTPHVLTSSVKLTILACVTILFSSFVGLSRKSYAAIIFDLDFVQRWKFILANVGSLVDINDVRIVYVTFS